MRRRAQSAPTTPRADPRKSAAGDRLSAGDTSPRVCAPLAAAAEYIIKQTARPSRRASFAERQCVGPDYRAVPRRTPDRFRSYLAPPAPTRRPGAPSDVTRSCGASSLPLIYRCRATRRRRRRRLTGRKSALHRRGLSAARPAGFCSSTFYDDDVLFFTFIWLMLIAKIKAATQR